MFEQFSVRTPEQACLVDITSQIEQLVGRTGIREGMCAVYIPHTTAGVTINEHADPAVAADLLKELEKLVPWRDGYGHTEGNSAAHIKASLVGCSQTVPVQGGRLRLGTWQGIFLAEFDGPRTRNVWVKVMAG